MEPLNDLDGLEGVSQADIMGVTGPEKPGDETGSAESEEQLREIVKQDLENPENAASAKPVPGSPDLEKAPEPKKEKATGDEAKTEGAESGAGAAAEDTEFDLIKSLEALTAPEKAPEPEEQPRDELGRFATQKISELEQKLAEVPAALERVQQWAVQEIDKRDAMLTQMQQRYDALVSAAQPKTEAQKLEDQLMAQVRAAAERPINELRETIRKQQEQVEAAQRALVERQQYERNRALAMQNAEAERKIVQSIFSEKAQLSAETLDALTTLSIAFRAMDKNLSDSQAKAKVQRVLASASAAMARDLIEKHKGAKAAASRAGKEGGTAPQTKSVSGPKRSISEAFDRGGTDAALDALFAG